MAQFCFLMRLMFAVQLICAFAASISGCKRHASQDSQASSSPLQSGPGAAGASKFDACTLLKNEEIEALQGSPVKEAKPSEAAGVLQTSQCFYLAAEFSKSVNISLTRVPPNSSNKSAAREFWKQTFSERERHEGREREADEEKRESLREQRREKEEEGAPLQKIDGLGDEAYWSGTRVGGALYVLKGDLFIRVSLGGANTNEARIEKARKLAAKALERL